MISIYTKTFCLIKYFINLLIKKECLSDIIFSIRLELSRGTNLLTGLPGSILLERELLRRTAENQPFSVIYVSLFKKKFSLTDENHIILFISKILSNIVKKYGGEKDFLAYINKDDFIIITEKKYATVLCEHTIKCFDSLIKSICKQIEQKENKKIFFSLEGGYPSISMSLIEYKEGEKASLRNISYRAKRMQYYNKSESGILASK